MPHFYRSPLSLALLTAILSYSETSIAGHQSSGGGGDAFACLEKSIINSQGKDITVEGHRFYLVDTYHFLKNRDNRQVRYIRESLGKEVWPALIRSLEERSPGMGQALSRTASMLYIVVIPLEKFNLNPKGIGKVQDFPDDHIREIPKNCRKVQVAIQDWRDATVAIMGSAYTALTEAERVFLILHESLIYARQRYGDTSELRNTVLNVVSSPSFYKNLQLERKKQGTHSVRRPELKIETWKDRDKVK